MKTASPKPEGKRTSSGDFVYAKFQPLLVFLLVVSMLLLTGFFLFNNLRTAVKQSVHEDLFSIATLKAEQINDWIDDRYSDAQSLGVDSYFSQGVQRWITAGKPDDQQRRQMQRQLDAFVVAHHFSSIVLFDLQGNELLQAGEHINDLAHMRTRALHAMSAAGIEFVDLHRHEHDVIRPAVGFISPLQVDGKVVGAIYFVESATRYLFPLLQTWPSPSATAELQLVRRESDRVLYLSPLRQGGHASLSFSLPMSTPDLAAATALRGSTGILPHVYDYRGETVLSFATPIKGTPWVLIAKIDKAEAYALPNRLQKMAIWAALLLLLTTGAWFRQWQRRQRLSFQAEEMELQRQSDARLLESEKRFRTVFEQAAMPMMRVALTGEFVEVNDAWCELFGYSREEVQKLPVSWQTVTFPDDLPLSRVGVTQLLAGEIPSLKVSKRYLNKDGGLIWGSVEASLVRNAQGEPDYLISAIQDITVRQQLEDQLGKNLELLKMAMEGAQEALWEWEVKSGEMKFSPEFYTLLGYLPDAFPATLDEWLSRIHPEERDALVARISEELAQNRDSFVAEYRMLDSAGSYRWLQVRGKCLAYDEQGQPARIVGIQMDINEHKQAELQLGYLAYHDKLTGLPNRALLFDRLSQAISQASRDKRQVALLFADLDGFKQVNDEFGHEVGDHVLKETAQRMLSCVRAVDTVVRLGGDEFAVILGSLEGAHMAAGVAEKLVRAFDAEIVLADGSVCRVGVSIGISIFPENGDTMDGLLTAADQAMYDSKRNGKNTYTFFSSAAVEYEGQWFQLDDSQLLGIPELDAQHLNLARLVNRLNNAWRKNQSHRELIELFNAIVAAAAEHFDTEAHYMEQCAYPGREVHEQEHARLLEEAVRLRRRLHDGGELLVIQTLKDWLINHIIGSDKQMASFLLSHGQSQASGASSRHL